MGDQVHLLVYLNICSIVKGKDNHDHLSVLLTVIAAKHWQNRKDYKDDKVAHKSKSGQREDYTEVSVTDETADIPLGC